MYFLVCSNLIIVVLNLINVIHSSEVDILCPTCSGLVVDTDCGGDDAMAISLLLKAEARGQTSRLGKIVGFTTITGNTGASNVTRNVHALLRILQRPEIPVYQGMEDGLSTHVTPTWFFGYDGLGDFLPPAIAKPILPNDINPGFYLASLVHKYPGQISILCIGPMTNLAMALHFNQDFFKDVKNVIILGGDYRGVGNVSPGVEANMFSDPDAAAFFFSKIPQSSAGKITLIPIEPILDIEFPMAFRTEVLGKYNSSLMNFLDKAESISLPAYGDKWPCYDPTAAAVLLDNKLVISTQHGWVEVVTQGPRGAMLSEINGKKSNVNIVTKIDQKRLTNVLKKYLTSDTSSLNAFVDLLGKTVFWSNFFPGIQQSPKRSSKIA